MVLAACLASTAAAGVLACGEPVSPPQVISEFGLASLGGEPLPAAPWAGGTARILGDTLRLRLGGTGVRILVQRAAPGAAELRSVDDFAWVVEDDTLKISFPCPPDALALCVAPPHIRGHLSGPLAFVTDIAIPYSLQAIYQPIGIR